jgi:nicotinamide mononucleotide transporter
MLAFFSVNTIAVSLLGYSLSYVELIGTIFTLWSVWLVARRKIANWPVGIVGGVLFLILFYQIRLYSDAFEQVYYVFIGFYGWWAWSRGPKANSGEVLQVRFSGGRAVLAAGAITAVCSLAAGAVMSRVNLFWPALFPEPASYPFLDALTTVMSFTATWLMAQKRVECWYYWIAVDLIGIVLYGAKGVRFIALLYVVFLFMAAAGLLGWKREFRRGRAGGQPAPARAV